MGSEPSLLGCIDSHFHVREMEKKGLPVREILARCFADGMAGGVDVGVDLEGADTRRALIAGFPTVRYSAGLAPHVAGRAGYRLELELLERSIAERRPAAIGEIGLDDHWKYGTPEIQRELFVRQLDLAARFDLPVIIHSRDADEDMLEILGKHAPPRGGIMHCFSSDYRVAAVCVDLGFLISFAGNLTYKSSRNLHETVRSLPLDRLLFETDSPYLSPAPLRGRLNDPGNIGYVYACAAELRGMETEELVRTAAATFAGLFGA